VINRQGGAGDAWLHNRHMLTHMILEGRYIPDVIGGHTDWSSDGGLGAMG